MLSRHRAIGLQTVCMVIVLAPVVEAARLPRVCPMALGSRVASLVIMIIMQHRHAQVKEATQQMARPAGALLIYKGHKDGNKSSESITSMPLPKRCSASPSRVSFSSLSATLGTRSCIAVLLRIKYLHTCTTRAFPQLQT